MTTYFSERIYAPLSPDDASALVEAIDARIFSLLPRESDSDDDAPPSSEHEESAFAVFEDLTLEVSPDAPTSAAGAKEIARASGFPTSSFVLEDAAMKRLASCRSTILLRFGAELEGNTLFIAIYKRLLEDCAPVVVESGERTSFERGETFERRMDEETGGAWKAVRALPLRPESNGAKPKAAPGPKASAKPRAAAKATAAPKPAPAPNPRPKTKAAAKPKPGAIEALALRDALTVLLEGDDPLARESLRKGLMRAGQDVQQYAAALLDDHAGGDAQVAKFLGSTARDVKDARVALTKLLNSLEN